MNKFSQQPQHGAKVMAHITSSVRVRIEAKTPLSNLLVGVFF
jgi:hypothetical protein